MMTEVVTIVVVAIALFLVWAVVRFLRTGIEATRNLEMRFEPMVQEEAPPLEDMLGGRSGDYMAVRVPGHLMHPIRRPRPPRPPRPPRAPRPPRMSRRNDLEAAMNQLNADMDRMMRDFDRQMNDFNRQMESWSNSISDTTDSIARFAQEAGIDVSQGFEIQRRGGESYVIGRARNSHGEPSPANPEATIEGVALQPGDRVMISNSSNPENNGVYRVSLGDNDASDLNALLERCLEEGAVTVDPDGNVELHQERASRFDLLFGEDD